MPRPLLQFGKPMVVVLKNGRALALEGAVANAPAILVTWFLGTETGHAIADVLFGAFGPSGPPARRASRARRGSSPIITRTSRPAGRTRRGQLEAYKAHFRGIPNTALYPFGHGLTYGKIEYAGLALGAPTLPMSGEITVSAAITNRGRRAAEEVVQLYIHDRTASITRPVRELKAFRKLKLAPGQSETVAFKLRAADLQFIGRDNRPTVEPGTFDVWIAPSAESRRRSRRRSSCSPRLPFRPTADRQSADAFRGQAD